MENKRIFILLQLNIAAITIQLSFLYMIVMLKKYYCISGCLIAAFLLWTGALCFVDVKAIGPEGSCVGFASVNGYIHEITDANMALYTLTDWLGLVPMGIAFGFALLGLFQWIKRKKLLKVDKSILAMGVFYVFTAAVYFLFENFVVNFRPVLIEGVLEASYPSSTTVLTVCVMSTAAIWHESRIKNPVLRKTVLYLSMVFTVFMVAARLVSGVHWLSDIIGGILISAGLTAAYYAYICDNN